MIHQVIKGARNLLKQVKIVSFVISVTASSLIWMISLLATDANRDAIFFPNCSEVNSIGNSEFDKPVRTRLQRYPLFYYILMRDMDSHYFSFVKIPNRIKVGMKGVCLGVGALATHD